MRRWKGPKSKSDQQSSQKTPVAVVKPRPALMMALEPRMMFDAAAVATAEAAHADHTEASSASPPASVVFVDARVKDADALLANVAAGTEVVHLDVTKDGLQQIASYLSEKPGATSVQIIAEGYTGDLWLGATYLSADNIAEHATTLAQIGAGMEAGGDILIFGCNTGAGEQGNTLVTSLATLTGRDVAASDDRTGAHGDWDLEIVKGTIESSSALSLSATASYAYDLATITVTSNEDSGLGTLREALDVTAVAGDTITFLDPMTISLTSGSLVINKSLTIDGDLDNDGASDVILDANYTSRVLTVTGGSVSLRGLELREGLVSGDGGGYADPTGGDALGAGLLVTGSGTTVTILDSNITANRAAGGGGGGAGEGYSYGGGGGGGAASTGGGSGGAFNASYPGIAGGDGIGGDGGYDNSYDAAGAARVGKGGSSIGGAGGTADSEGVAAGGAGATASGIGGGGGGAGRVVGYGGRGGNAVGGIYIGVGATVYMARSTVSLNWGAGGGGGGSYNAVAGDGGAGTGAIRVLGTLKYESSTTMFTSNVGAGADGGGSYNGVNGTSGSSNDDIDGVGGSVDMSWAPADTTPPMVSSVSLPADTTYVAGQNLDFTVNFDEAVFVDTGGGTPYIALTLDTGGSVQAVYLSGGGTTALLFRYTVVSGNLDADGISVDSSITANGGTLRDAADNDASLTLNEIGSTAGVLIDAVVPIVESITPTAETGPTNATSVQYTVTFSENVTGVDAADFALTTTSGDVTGMIASVSGDGTTYTITVDGITGEGTLRLDLNGSGTGITDDAGNAIGDGFTAGDVYTFDRTAPSVSSVSVPADGTYTAGQDLDIIVNFDEAVTVDEGGTPYITITLDTGGSVQAYYAAGSQTSALTFRYTVASGELDSDGISLGSITLDGATIRDDATNDAILTLNNIGSTAGVLVDAVAPMVASIDRVTAATTNATSVDYTVTFTENVTNVDVEDFMLATTGTANGAITSITGSGTTYTVTVGSVSGDGTLRLDVNSETDITDVPGTVLEGGFTGEIYTIDNTAPVVTAVTLLNSSGSYGVASTIDFKVDFDENVEVDTTEGVPRLPITLDTGDTVYADYLSGSGTTALIFTYTVVAGHLDLTGVSLDGSIDPNGGTLRDSAGNDVDATLNNIGDTTAVLIDAVAPTVTSITRVGEATTTNATSLQYTVTFSEAVRFVSASNFTLTSTGTASGTVAGVTTSDQVTYTVTVNSVSGDGTLRLDLSSTLGIVDTPDNALASGFTAGEAYTLDQTAPSVTSIVRVAAATTNATSVQYTVTFSENVSGVDPSFFSLTTTGDTTGTIDSISGEGGTYTVTVSGITGDGTLRLDLNSSGTEISDDAGNAIAGGFTAGEAYTLDYTAPSVTSVSVPTSGTYGAGQSLDFTVNFDESISVDTTGGTPSLAITLDTGGTVFATYVSGSGTTALIFSYTVMSGELDSNGISVGSLGSNDGTLRDAAGNDADLTLNNVASAAAVLVDAVAPTVDSITRVDAATSNATSVQYTVTFSESVSGVDTSDFVLAATGTAAGTIASVSGSGTTYTVTVNSISGDGTLRLDLNSSGTGIADVPGNAIGSGFISGEAYTFDHTAPVVTSVSVPASGTYAAGDSLDFTVQFDENVTFETAGGTPRIALTLDTGGTVYASYLTGSGTSAITFRYIVASGNLDIDGISVASSIEANGGTVRDAVGNDANLTLNSVGGTADVLVDGVAPTVTSINRVSGETTKGSTLQFTVTFSEGVVGVDSSDFALTTTGSVAGTIGAVTGSGTTYTVTVNSISGEGTLRLDVNGSGTGITDSSANAIAGGFTGGQTYTIDHTAPTVTGVSVPSTRTYSTGQNLDFVVNFTEGVTVDTTAGVPRIALTLGSGGTVYATYVSGDGTSALTFRHVVTSGELDADGISVGSSIELDGAVLYDAAGNEPSNLTLNGVGDTSGVLVDAVAPSVASITRVTAQSTNATTVQYTVTFTENVGGVDAADFFVATTGSLLGTIGALSGSGTTYTVTIDTNGGEGDLRLDLNSSSTGITDLAGNAISGGFTTGEIYSFDHGIPTVTSVAVPASGTYVAGDSLDFTVSFDDTITVDSSGGTPRLAIVLDGMSTVYASYVSGSGTDALTFRYLVSAGDLDSDGIVVDSLDANGGTLRDEAGNPADLGLVSVAPTDGIRVDAVAPSVTSIVRVGTATTSASSVAYTVRFSEAVMGVDVADFTLTATGATTGTIAAVSQVDASTYTVTVTGISGDGTLRLDANATGITDLAGNATTSAFLGGEVYIVDQTAPSVSSVGVPMAGTYVTGQSLDFTVNFDEVVAVDTSGGTPRVALALDTGGTVYASYVSGSGTSALLFSYTVMSGELDSNGISVLSIDANGGTLRDGGGNDATLTLNGVGSTAGVLVDAVAPSVASITGVNAPTTNASSVQYTVTFSESVTGVDAADFALTATGTAAGTIAAVSGSGTTYTVTVNDITGDGTLRLDLNGTGTAISDAAGNTIAGSFTSGAVYTFDHTAPTVTSVSVPSDAIYIAGQHLDFTVNFSEIVTVGSGGTPFIFLDLDNGGTVQALYDSGSGSSSLVFRYTVADGNLDSTGVSFPFSTIITNGATLRDLAGNDADRTLNNVGTMTGVTIDARPPSVASITRLGAVTTNAQSVAYTVTFFEDVIGVDVTDFALTATGTAVGTIASISGSGATYTVTVNNISGDGTLRLDLNSGSDISDIAGNPIDGFNEGEIYIFDHTAPSVTAVSVVPGTYAAGRDLDLKVDFDDVVTVDTTGGTPRIALTLDTGGIVYASYVSGGGTDTLTFRYTVVSGGLDSDGIVVDGSIDTNGGTLRDNVGNDAVLALNGVDSTTGVLVDAVAPSVTSITRVGSATSNATSVAYTVTFSEPVTGIRLDDFSLARTGTANGVLASISGSGATYTVVVNAIGGDGTLRLDLTSGRTDIGDIAGNPIVGGFTGGESYTFDHTPPSVASVAVPANGTYGLGDTLDFKVTFDESVIVDETGGSPRLALTLDTGGSAYATYVSGSGTSELSFVYTVMSGELDSSGIGLAGSIDVNGGTLRDASGNDATLLLSGVGSTTGVLVDAVAPSVTSITRVGVATTSASSVAYTVTFSESVSGVDVSDFALTATGAATGTIASVTPISGSVYVVTVSSITGDGTLRLDLNSSRTGITDVASNAIGGGFISGEAYAFDHTVVDTTAPAVVSVALPSDATYTSGDTLNFIVNFDEVVTVDTSGGTPRIAITLDTGGTVYAGYVSGSETSALTFSYTVIRGQLDSDGITVGSSIEANGGTLRDGVGNDAVLALGSVGSTAAVLVDAVAPSVVSITRVDAATSNATSVQYTVTFSESVSGLDISDFALTTTGTAAGTIALVSGSGTTYTVTVDSITGDGTLRLDLSTNGTGIVDLPGTAIESGFTTGEVYTFDHTAPSIASVAVPASGTYAGGDTLDFTVTFDESIVVDTIDGTPRIALELDGGGTVYANYVSGSGTSVLTFRYTMDVAFDTGFVVGGSIEPNGATLRDGVGNDATLALNGVGDTSGVRLDGVQPAVATITANGSPFSNATSMAYTVTFSEDVSGLGLTDFSLSTTGTVACTIQSIMQVDGSTYIVNVTGITGDGTLRLDLKDSGTSIVDTAGNPIAGGFAGDIVDFDHSPPVILAVEVPAGGAYGVGEALEFRIRFDDRVDVDTTGGSPRLALLLSSGAIVYADYAPDKAFTGSTLTFRYVVAADFDGDGISVAGIDLNGGRLVSPLGVDVDLTLNGVGDVSAVTVDAVAPSIASITRLDASMSNADSATYLVTFSEDVSGIRAGSFSLTTTGTLSITTGAMRRTGGNTFLVTISGIRGDGTLQLHVNGAGVTDLAGTALGGESIAGEIYTFDHTPPSIVTVELPANGNYVAGQSLDFTVNFNESVTVETTGGTPRIAITLGSGTVYADYVSGSGTTALTFRYVVGSVDSSPNGVVVASSIELNGAILTDAVGNRAEPATTNVGALTGVTVGTRPSIVITPTSPIPSSNPIIITPLPTSSALPPILNAFNSGAGGITIPTSLIDGAGAPGSIGGLPGVLPNRETGTQSNGNPSSEQAAASTSNNGFVTLRDNRAGETGVLRAGAALQPLTLPANRPFELRLPNDTFIGGAGSRIAVEARLADGKPLPSWLKFDPRTGKFVGTPPPGQGGAISIQVIARDGNGEAAVVVLDLQLGADEAEVTDQEAPDGEPVSSTSSAPALDQVAAAPGKASLNSQFRAHGFNAWRQQVDTLVQHAREPAPSLSIATVKQS